MAEIAFLLNGDAVRVPITDPTETLLDWLRETRGLTGTKEGCNEGDCGACTVMVTGADGIPRSLNACILFLPQIDGCAVRTVEGIASRDGTLHPVQQAMIDHHGAQCGFCTPGIVVSLATAHATGATNFNDQLAGNLCRCTGYAPILRAAEASCGQPVPDWIMADASAAAAPAPLDDDRVFRPANADALADWYLEHPDATLVAGATDVGLWVTKQFRDLGAVAFLNGADDLRGIDITDDAIRIGAMTTLSELLPVMTTHFTSFGELIRRYASVQVRNAATIGGNVANGSPIGDSPPILIALGATLHLRKGDARRSLPLEDFFLDYGKQDRAPGEFVEAISIPRQPDRLRCYKISKRFDQDISALCAAFNITVEGGLVVAARIAFGGMAGIPQRASETETALIGAPWTPDGIAAAQEALGRDFTPMTDMRASANYRLTVARNLLMRACLEDGDQTTAHVLEVRP